MLDPEPSKEVELAARVRELKKLLGKITLKNEFIKKLCATPQTGQEKTKLITENSTLIQSAESGC
jgi:hypothetical protein